MSALFFSPQTFHLLRHLALTFLGLGLVYGLLVSRHAQPALISPWALVAASVFPMLHASLFLLALYLWGPAPLGMALHHLAQVPAAAFLLGLWFVKPYRDEELRRFLGLVIVGLVFILAFAALVLFGEYHPLPWIKALVLALLLGCAFAFYRSRLLLRGERFVQIVAVGLFGAGLVELFWARTLEQMMVAVGLAEFFLAPLLWAWSYTWLPLPEVADTGSPPVSKALTSRQAQALLFPYLEQLDALLQAQSLQQPWNPVPSVIQTVFTWLHHRLGSSREPRTHTPLMHLVERVLERHEKDLVEQNFQLACFIAPHLSLDPSLGEWLLELGMSYVLRYAAPNVVVECRLQGGQDPVRGPMLFLRLRHSVRERPRGLPESWFEPALALGRLFLLDIGGDWWVVEEDHLRTIWMWLPLQGFGKILHPARGS